MRVYNNSILTSVFLLTADFSYSVRICVAISNKLHRNADLVQKPVPASALPFPHLRPRHHQAVLSPGHADVEQPSRFLQLELIQRAVARNWNQLLVLDADYVDARKLQTLGRVHGEQVHSVW